MTGEKTVLTGHSMGSQVIFYFMKWAEAEGYGGGGPNWVNDHIESFVDISGSMLGTPKTLVALLSGEMKDTVQLNAMAVYGLEQFFSRRERADLLRTWGGIASMIPKGGKAIWGDHSGAPDDEPGQNVTFGNFIKFKESLTEYSAKNLTMDETVDFLYSQSPEWFVNRTEGAYSFGIAKTRKQVEQNEKRPSTWSNPLEAALPNAPDLKIYCFYGVGKDTERAYYYQDEPNPEQTNLNVSIAGNDPDGVLMGQGDGTVSLVTHTMCHRWKDENSKFNPGNAQVKVVEMLHQPDRLDIRGGAQTAEHVDILGRSELNEMVLKVASGKGNEIEERVISNIDEWVWKIDLGSN
jgi:phospholipid:diacylglycerol acyltransferase